MLQDLLVREGQIVEFHYVEVRCVSHHDAMPPQRLLVCPATQTPAPYYYNYNNPLLGELFVEGSVGGHCHVGGRRYGLKSEEI